MKYQQINFKVHPNNYSILVGNNIIGVLPKKIKIICPKVKKIALVFDSNVPTKIKRSLKSILKKYELIFLNFNASEKSKSIKTVNSILEKLLRLNFNRSDLIISIGGGITGDVSGFVASIFKRGINFISIPTTLLAQADAAVGGKTGVNSIYGKNLIGSFYQPKLVISDTSVLSSLSRKDFTCGYAEILKHAIIKDKNFFIWLKKNTKNIFSKKPKYLNYAIKKSCLIKLSFVDRDFKESSLRMKLNFGHTFAHAIESYDRYLQKYNHGEAVLIGMVIATKVSNHLKICNDDTLNNIIEIYKKNSLINYVNKFKDFKNLNNLIKFMKNDKKNYNEKISLILLKDIGKTTIPGRYIFSTDKIRNILKNLNN